MLMGVEVGLIGSYCQAVAMCCLCSGQKLEGACGQPVKFVMCLASKEGRTKRIEDAVDVSAQADESL